MSDQTSRCGGHAYRFSQTLVGRRLQEAAEQQRVDHGGAFAAVFSHINITDAVPSQPDPAPPPPQPPTPANVTLHSHPVMPTMPPPPSPPHPPHRRPQQEQQPVPPLRPLQPLLPPQRCQQETQRRQQQEEQPIHTIPPPPPPLLPPPRQQQEQLPQCCQQEPQHYQQQEQQPIPPLRPLSPLLPPRRLQQPEQHHQQQEEPPVHPFPTEQQAAGPLLPQSPLPLGQPEQQPQAFLLPPPPPPLDDFDPLLPDNHDDEVADPPPVEPTQQEPPAAAAELPVPPHRHQVADVTLSEIQDGIVSQGTLSLYLGDIMEFLQWVQANHPTWFTPHGIFQYNLATQRLPVESVQAHKARACHSIEFNLCNARENPILFIPHITLEAYISFLSTLHNRHNGLYLSKSAYGGKRASLNHVFHLHNSFGFPEAFKLELSNLFRGFFRSIVQCHVQDGQRGGCQRQPNRNFDPAASDDAPGAGAMDGKEPMSVELYCALCQWFLAWGTTDGVFAHVFLVVTWNLMCRARNTAFIERFAMDYL